MNNAVERFLILHQCEPLGWQRKIVGWMEGSTMSAAAARINAVLYSQTARREWRL